MLRFLLVYNYFNFLRVYLYAVYGNDKSKVSNFRFVELVFIYI